jgi:hypothetical protein
LFQHLKLNKFIIIQELEEIKIGNLPVIISCYSQSNNESSVLSINIEQLYNYGHPICVTSHKLINRDLEDKIDYFIYTKENHVLPKKFGSDYYTYYFTSDNFKYFTNFGGSMGGHSYAIILNLLNGLNLLKSKGYKFFMFLESDTVIDYKSYNDLLEHLKEFDFSFHNSYFFSENGLGMVGSSMFIGDIDFFISKLENFGTIEKYINHCEEKNISYGLEVFLSNVFYYGNDKCLINEHRIGDIIKNDFLGCLSGGQIIIKDFKTYNWWLDIVRHENSEAVFLIISPSNTVEDITMELYYDNILKNTSNKTICGSYLYEIITDLNFKEISYIAKKNGKIIKQATRSKEDIFDNIRAYAQLL